VDLRSNGGWRKGAPWTRPWARSMGPPWTSHLNRRGTRSPSSARDPTALDECVRRAAAMTPGTGAERRRAAAARRREPSTALRATTLTMGWRKMMWESLRTCSWALRARLGLTGGRHREGAAWLLRRARGEGTGRDKEGNWAGRVAYHTQEMRTGQRVERRWQQGGLVTAAARAALR
jgi:hypothetical protein